MKRNLGSICSISFSIDVFLYSNLDELFLGVSEVIE